MTGTQIKQHLAAGGRVYGTVFVYITHPSVVDILPDKGLDFVMVHVEHSAYDLADYLPLRYALANKGIACIARTHSRDPDDISRICDVFPDGVVVPYAEDPEELKRLMGAAKYRPLKGESLQRLLDTGEWPSDATRQYITDHNAGTLFIPMIESTTALDDLDSICSVDGIDALLIGPNDLTVSMGIPEERDNPVFVDAVQNVINAAEKQGIAAGCHTSRMSHALRTIDQGGRLVLYSSDSRLLQFGIPQMLDELGANTAAGEEAII